MFPIYLVIVVGVASLVLYVLTRKRPADSAPLIPSQQNRETNELSHPQSVISELPSTGSSTRAPVQTLVNGDHDAWEGSFWDVREPFAVQAHIRFHYEDGSGSRTVRTVDVRQMGNDGYGNLLIGHCHLRNATRTFRPERMTECVDLETGGMVDDVYGYLHEKYDRSPECSRDKLLQDEYDALRLLLYVGKADGQLREPERVVLRDACRTLAKDSRVSDTLVDEAFANIEVLGLVPSLQSFRLIVGRLAKRPEGIRTLLLGAAERIVATQKTVHPLEKDALDYLKKRFVERQLTTSGN